MKKNFKLISVVSFLIVALFCQTVIATAAETSDILPELAKIYDWDEIPEEVEVSEEDEQKRLELNAEAMMEKLFRAMRNEANSDGDILTGSDGVIKVLSDGTIDFSQEIKDIYVKLLDERLIAVYDYGSETELFGVVLERRGANKIFDYNAFFTVSKDFDFASLDITEYLPLTTDPESDAEPETDKTDMINSYYSYNHVSENEAYMVDDSAESETFIGFFKEAVTDTHSPYAVNTLGLADGDRTYKLSFTGGNHSYDEITNEGSATGVTDGVVFYIDGECYDEYDGYASRLDIYYENSIQASNTIRIDGSGRNVINEANFISFDGEKWNSSITVTALEDVAFYRYYGLQFDTVGFGDTVSFVYDDERTSEHKIGTFANSVDTDCNMIRISGGDIDVEIAVTSDFSTCNHTSYSAFAESYKKTYFNIINAATIPLSLSQEETFSVEGYYKFSAHEEIEEQITSEN